MRSMKWVQLINWEHSSWKYLSLIGDEGGITLSHANVYVFSDSVLCLGKMSENPQSNTVWENRLTWFKSSSQYRVLDRIDGEPMEFENNIFPGFTTLQLFYKVQEFQSKMSKEPEDFTRRIIFVSMFNDISWWSKDTEQECELSTKLVSIKAKDFHQEDGHSSDLDQKRSGILLMIANHKENGTGSQSWWWSHSAKADTQSSDPRVHYPEECSKAKVVENYQHTSALMTERLTLFCTTISVNQLSINGAVSDLCEECKSCHVRTGRPVLVGQSDPLFVPTSSLMKTPTPSTDDPVQENLLQKYQERVDKLSQQNRWLNFVMMQDSWQRLMSDSTSWQKTLKNSHNLQSQWLVVGTLCQEMKKSSDLKSWIRGNTKIGPVLEVTISYWQGKYGVEIGIESVNKDTSHMWVRIPHGLNKLVTDLIDEEYDDNEQETSEMQFEDFALKTNVLAFASRSKAKAKPRRSTSAWSSTRTVLLCERTWTDVEPGTYSNIDYPVSKQLSLLRHGQLPREEDGVIEFWRLKDYLRNDFENSQLGPMKCRRATRRDFNIVRALQGHSGRNLFDLSLQDNVLILDNFVEYIYHIGCAINIHTITN